MNQRKSSRPLSDGARVKRRHIVDIAAVLFDEKGYHRVSMEDIAGAAGLAKPSVYHYFRGKTQILSEIHYELILPLLERARERAKLNLPPATELHAIIVDVLKLFGGKPGHMRVFFEHLRELPLNDRTQILSHRAEYREIIEAALNRGSAEGDFDVKDPQIAALTFLGAVNWAYHWFQVDAPLSAEEVADRIWDTLWRGLAVRAPVGAVSVD